MADQQAIYSPRVTHNKTAHARTTTASQGDYVINLRNRSEKEERKK